jgi:hypothetical protein
VESTEEPKILLRQVSLARDTLNQLWRVGWEVENRGDELLRILSARLPHGQFKCDERRFVPGFEVAAGEGREFQTLVHCEEPPGLVTENAFVIFQCQWRGEAWRIFVRIRVTVDASGEPSTGTELITAQQIGFSGIAN